MGDLKFELLFWLMFLSLYLSIPLSLPPAESNRIKSDLRELGLPRQVRFKSNYIGFEITFIKFQCCVVHKCVWVEGEIHD